MNPFNTQVVDSVKKSTEMLLSARTHYGESVLLYGPRGAGKSGIAAHIATLFKFTFVKVREMILKFNMNPSGIL